MFLICSLLITSCKHDSKSISSETKAFKNYLSSTFQISVGQQKHYYFLVPGTQCKGCNLYDAHEIDSALNKKITIISTFPPTNFLHFKNVLEDTSKTLLTLPFVNYSNKLIVTEGGHVLSVLPVYAFFQQIDSLSH